MSSPSAPAPRAWEQLVDAALSEDLGSGDVTSALVFTPEDTAQARIEARQDLVVCGLSIAEAVFARVDPQLRVTAASADGDAVPPYAVLLHVEGPVTPPSAAPVGQTAAR